MLYSIGEFSELTGLGVHTLRYYEQEGLLTPGRTDSNRRRYSEEDAAWVAFLRRLKDTGMPLKEIQQFARLRREGEATIQERLELLMGHQQALEEQIMRLKEHQEKLGEKIAFYQRQLLERTGED